MLFVREYTFPADGAEYLAYESDGWSKVTICNRGSGNASITLNRKKRTPLGFYEDAYQLPQVMAINQPTEFFMGHGDSLYVQGDSSDQVEIAAGPLPLGQFMGPPSFPSRTETRELPMVGSSVKPIILNPNEFCEAQFHELVSGGSSFVFAINKSVLASDTDIPGSTRPYRVKLNRNDQLVALGLTGVVSMSILVTPLPTLGGLIGDLVC